MEGLCIYSICSAIDQAPGSHIKELIYLCAAIWLFIYLLIYIFICSSFLEEMTLIISRLCCVCVVLFCVVCGWVVCVMRGVLWFVVGGVSSRLCFDIGPNEAPCEGYLLCSHLLPCIGNETVQI